MSFISDVGGIICLCCVISAAVGIIAPLGNTKKIMNVVMGIFLLAVVISSFTKTSVDFSQELYIMTDGEELSAEYEDYYENEVISVAEEKLCEYTDYILKQEGIEASDIRIILETDSDHGIYVEEINIYINQEQNRLFRTKINSLIKNDFKVFPNIITVDEGKEA